MTCLNFKGAPPKGAEVVKMKSKPEAEVGEVRGTVTAARAALASGHNSLPLFVGS